MPTILLVQEFGSNYGHIARLVAVAGGMEPCRLVFAVPDPALAAGPVRHFCGADPAIVLAPQFKPSMARVARAEPDKTLADVFHGLGYADPDALLAAAAQWQDLVQQVRPDIIISDFAPTLRLAIWNRVPIVVVTGSFSTPPAGERLPVVLPGGGPLTATSVRHEDELLAACQTVRVKLNGPSLNAFSDLFGGERVFAATVPVIDPYNATRSMPPVSPFPTPRFDEVRPFSQRTGPHVFCYLWRSHPAIDVLVTALNGLARPSQIHIRGLDPIHVARQCAPQVTVRTDAADFGTLLPQTRLFIHYAGAGASYAGLLAGVAQLVVPTNLEQEITAGGLTGTGAAVSLAVAPHADPAALRRIIEAQLDNPAREAAALAAASHHRTIHNPDPRPVIVAACRELMRIY